MALTLANQTKTSIGARWQTVTDVTFDNGYTTGGLSLTGADLGLPIQVDFVVAPTTGGIVFSYDYTASKLKAFYPTGGAGTAAAGSGSGGTPKVASGASTGSAVDATTPNVTPGVGKEVANTTDLSAVVVKVKATGR